MELETAVRLKCNLVHVVWIDGFYDMVGIQEMAKYGRLSGVKLGPVDIMRFAEAFGAKGLRIERPGEISSTLKKALARICAVEAVFGDCANLSHCAGVLQSR